MRKTIAALMLAGGVAALAGGAALAGPQYVDASGHAVSGFDVVSYFDGGQPAPGRADITAEWNGATWAFASEENRDRFLADPEAFAPAYDGHCAFGVAKGGKVPGDPQLWRIVDGTLYLNLQKSFRRCGSRTCPATSRQRRRTGPASRTIPPRTARCPNSRPAPHPSPPTDSEEIR